MNLRDTTRASTSDQRLSHHWSGKKIVTRAEIAAGEALAGAAPTGTGDADASDVFVIDWSELDGTDVLA